MYVEKQENSGIEVFDLDGSRRSLSMITKPANQNEGLSMTLEMVLCVPVESDARLGPTKIGLASVVVNGFYF